MLMRPLPLKVYDNGKGRTVFNFLSHIKFSVMSYTEKKQIKEVKSTSTIKKVIRRQKIIEEKSVILCAEKPTVRYLKLQPFYRQAQTNYGHKYKKVPELRLCGNWLEQAGFLPENYVSVTVMNGLLVIRSTAAVEMNY
jgi:hypothetical protein